MLPHRAICANLDGVARPPSSTSTSDVLVSWLPLYHDMGLVGFVMLPLTTGVPVVLARPQDFLGAPSRWMEWLSAFKGHGDRGPQLLLGARRPGAAHGQRASTSRRSASRSTAPSPSTPTRWRSSSPQGRRFGLRPGAVFPAFGMAELVIGGTFPEPMSGLRTDCVDRHVLETEGYAATRDAGHATASRRFALLGRPVAGPRDPHHRPGDRRVDGRARGRRARDPWHLGDHRVLQAPRRHRRGVPGWLAAHGRPRLHRRRRARRLRPHQGRRSSSAAATSSPRTSSGRSATIDGVRAGNVIAFGVEGKPGQGGVVVVAESRTDDPELTRKFVAERVREAVGVPAKDIVLVAPGSLPKTSSGKLQRVAVPPAVPGRRARSPSADFGPFARQLPLRARIRRTRPVLCRRNGWTSDWRQGWRRIAIAGGGRPARKDWWA